MFDRRTQQQLEALFYPIGTHGDLMLRHSQGLLLLLKIIMSVLTTVKGVWDNGFNKILDAADPSGVVAGATVRWWRLAQAAFLIFGIFMQSPFSYLASLTDPLGNSPFDVFDPEVLGELADCSFQNIAYAGPETELPAPEPEPEA